MRTFSWTKHELNNWRVATELQHDICIRHFANLKPTHKLFLIQNHKPRIKSQAMAMWRRIKMIRLTPAFQKVKRTRICRISWERSAKAFFYGLLAVVFKWAKEGLPEPSEVENATRSYKVDEDRLARFIDERCIIAQTAQSEVSSIRRSYNEWCIEAGEFLWVAPCLTIEWKRRISFPSETIQGVFGPTQIARWWFLNVAPINKHNREVFSQMPSRN